MTCETTPGSRPGAKTAEDRGEPPTTPTAACASDVCGDRPQRRPRLAAAGPNDRPGGSEHLDWHTWDVAEFEGKAAVIEIVDAATGGWGHINVDHIVQGDARKQAEPARRELVVERRYLHLPVKTGAPMR